ncbi:hypothetical protein ACN26Z_14860 [Verrucosispora sp. WMMD703]|uniref:hypothetical protein n=1 Tax=Verrucosispora sp. WMMD703 TaxID=3403463 RepID=UPI003B9575BC
MWALLMEAHERRVWRALGYNTWEAYVRDRFDMARRTSYQVLDQARVIRAIEEATEDVRHGAQITERQTRDIKPILGEVVQTIRQRVTADPGQAQRTKRPGGRATGARTHRAAGVGLPHAVRQPVRCQREPRPPVLGGTKADHQGTHRRRPPVCDPALRPPGGIICAREVIGCRNSLLQVIG